MAGEKMGKDKPKKTETGKGKKTKLAVVGGGKEVVPATGKEERADLRKKVIEARDSIDTARWTLAEALYEVHDKTVYRLWGYSSWEQYVESEVGMTVRTAHYLTSIHGWFSVDLAKKLSSEKMDELRERLRKLGWTKVRSLVRIADAENVSEWVDRAEKMSSADLEETVKRELKSLSGEGGSGPTEVFKKKNFKLVDEQLQTVDQALEMAGGIADSEKPGHLLQLICQDFISTNMAGKEDGRTHKGRYLDKIGAVFGVKLVALDVETKKVVHGEDLVDKILSKKE
jgi:hypothetical protein